MPTSQQRSRYEAKLSMAHRALYWAIEAAEAMGDEGAVDDCTAINGEISRLMSDSLKGRNRPRRQLTMVDGDCA